ncbi:MAG: LytR C-terminal domain-containing protein [bacterium]|nr:LytR C-terminal domain-containing protein [bacterium]
MPARKKKLVVEVENLETPIAEETTVTEDKVVWVTEAEPEVKPETPPTPVAEPEVPEIEEPAESKTPNSESIFGPSPVEAPKSNTKMFWILIVLFTLLGAAAGALGIYLQGRGSPLLQPSPTPEATLVPSPTPQVELNRQDLNIQILNGGGVPGAAKSAQTYLEKLGYIVAGVGNAETSDYPTTQIAIKDDKKDFLSLLKDDLSGKYTLTEAVDSLDTDSEFDAVVILGKE